MAKNKNNRAIWGNRIKNNTSKLFEKIGSSIHVDKRLYKEDAFFFIRVFQIAWLFLFFAMIFNYTYLT